MDHASESADTPAGGKPMISHGFDGRDWFVSLTSHLPDLPAEGQQEVPPLEAWDIGEQEGAIEALINELLRLGMAVTERDRGQLAGLAEHWGTWPTVAGRISALTILDEDDVPWELIEGTREATRVREALRTEIGPGHLLFGKELVVWMACGSCDTVLVRVHDLDTWGLIHPAGGYALVHPTRRGSTEQPPWPITELHADALAAIDALEACGR
jgi:hypothetical protein